jgi:hypothetical protein
MNAECRTAQVAGSLVGRGCPPTFCIAHCTQEEIAQLVGASRSTRHSPNSPAAAGSASMTRRCGSATLNTAPAGRNSRRAVVERPPSTCCGSWPAGCAAPTTTWPTSSSPTCPAASPSCLLQPAQRFGTQDDGARRVTHELAVAGFDLGNQLSKTDTRTHLAAVRGVADAAPAAVEAVIASVVAGPQHRRRARAQPPDPDELVTPRAAPWT